MPYGRSKGLNSTPAHLLPPGVEAGAVRPLFIEAGRELTDEDLVALSIAPTRAIFPTKHVRAIHHRQAQLVALGRPDNEVAAICGTSSARVRDLRTNPAFADLVSYYQEQRIELDYETHLRIQGKLVDILELTTNEIQERLDDDAKRAAISLSELRKTAEFAADRTIAPPRATQQGNVTPPTKISLNFGWAPKKDQQIEAQTIDVTPEN
jgi:hypothetical protein